MKSVWRVEDGCCLFETDAVSGRYLTAGTYQGMRSLLHRPTGTEVVAGEKLPGLVAPYRVFGNGRRYGDVRDRLSRVELQGECMQIAYPADANDPFDIVSLYHWKANVLDVSFSVTARVEMRAFEMGVASYLSAGFRGYICRQSNVWGETEPRFVPVDVNPMTDGYALFPRSEKVMATIFDGRWDLPPYPVRYSVPAYFEHPLAYRRHARSGVIAVGMADPTECYAVCMPVNNPPENPDPAQGYQAIYFYLFGRDLDEGETATARLRWVIDQHLSDAQVLERWNDFVAKS